MREAMPISPSEFAEGTTDGMLWPGDCVLFAYVRRGPVQWGIRRVQERALRDLIAGSDEPEAIAELEPTLLDCAAYTHAGMVLPGGHGAEMTSPRARAFRWAQRLRPGMGLYIVRPLRSSGHEMNLRARLSQAAAEMSEVALRHDPYPLRELLAYWFASLPGALAAPHFVEHFRDRHRDVCSGTVWTCWRMAGAVAPRSEGDSMPEAWYPGRMAWDAAYGQRYLRTVGRFVIQAAVSDGRGALAPQDPRVSALPRPPEASRFASSQVSAKELPA